MAGKKNNKVNLKFNFSWLYLLLVAGIIWLLFFTTSSDIKKMEWSQIREFATKGDVKEIVFVRNTFKGKVTLRSEVVEEYKTYFGDKVPKLSPHFVFLVSDKFNPELEFDDLNSQLPVDKQVKIIMDEQNDSWKSYLDWLFFPLIFIFIWFFIFRGIGKGSGGGGPANIFGIGKANLQKANNEQKITFKDVAGLYGAKEEVMEIVDFLKSPMKYTELGAKIPKGALLVGPPGTGKTLLAKAVAGEANVPFFSISGSDFVEMFVGVGASRVRDLFKQAKENAPCIVFIDEIDAVGRARGKNAGFSSNDERENTLNQLLTEMDGFGSNSGVIVLAATNRADILDKALTRAGRFDRQIKVELPEVKERVEIFEVHLRKIKVAKDFEIEFMAKHTPGFSGADIANVCNEAALTAARNNHKEVEQQDFLDAIDRIIGGLERKAAIMTEKEKCSIAHHEAGHATVSWLLPYAHPLFKVTLIPRGMALGAAWYLPEERKLWTKAQMIDEMCSLLGGRVAEEIINGEPSTGAQNDLERITNMAYAMVQYYGMSDKVGVLSFYDSTGAKGYDFQKPYSAKTAEIMDQEVKEIVEMVHKRTRAILEENKEGFLKMAALLLEKEVIFAKDVEEIFGPKVVPADPSERREDVLKKEEK